MIDTSTMLERLLSDPMVKMVMASDGVSADEVRLLVEKAGQRSADSGFIPPAHVIACCKQQSLCL